MPENLFIKTYGCQMNVYDSNRIYDLLNKTHGFCKTSSVEQADVILLNTCSIREKAQEKLFSQLGRWRDLKRKKPHLLIGVGGCVASQEGDAILKRAPYVDVIFGPQTLHRLPQLISQRLSLGKAAIDISFPEIEKFDHLPAPSVHGPSAFVSIMEGCNKYCTYCVVPYTRGEEISRKFDDVISEIYHLAKQGVREVNLLGQNVNAYLGSTHEDNPIDLALLIKYIATIDGIERIRFTTSHPIEFSDNLINIYSTEPRLVGHLHLPVQSGSDKILSLMKRGHTAIEYKNKIARIKANRPGISISSDFIVGFPGETQQDFEQTMDLIKEIGFDHSFSFIFSPRPGTPAADLADTTPMIVKKQRLAQLQTCIKQQAQLISQRMVNTTVPVLIENISKKNLKQISGRTENNRVVNLIGEKNLIGQIVPVIITENLPNSLRGRLSYSKLKDVDA